MARSIAGVTLVVRDYDEAIAFYTGPMGFRLVEDTSLGGGKRWVRVAPPGGAGATLLLARAATPEQAARVGDQVGGRVALFLHTDEFRADYEAMQSRGVTFVEEPREEAYGTVAVFLDLYSNRWDLVQPRAVVGRTAADGGARFVNMNSILPEPRTLMVKDVATDIDHRLATTSVPGSPNKFTAAEVRDLAVEYLGFRDEEARAHSEIAGQPHWNLWMADARFEDALFAVLVFLPNGAEFLCGTGDAFAIKRFAESDCPDNIEQVPIEMGRMFAVPTGSLHLSREVAEGWLGRGW